MSEQVEKAQIEIEGLQSEGPGDIVGAIASNTGLSPRILGEIDIQGGRAVVEVEPDVADRIVKIMNRNRIGRSKVRVTRLEMMADKSENPDEYYIEHWSELVELEREEEMREHENEINNLSGEERQAKGRALLDLRGRSEGEDLSGFLVKFMRRQKGQQLPEHEINVGDLVMLSKDDPLREDNPTGTVTATTKYSVTVSFREKPPPFVAGKNIRMDLYVNDITYQRMLDALKALDSSTGSLRALFDVLNGTSEPAGSDETTVEYWYNHQLNESQKEAVARAVGAGEFFLIHGPPGTGKTTTVIELIRQAISRGQSVLATADSNTAVDNLIEFLVEEGVHAIRIGHPARVTATLQEHTLDALVQENRAYQRARELRDEAFEIKEQQDEELTHPSGRWRRGLSDKRIKELADQGKGSRGVSPEKISEMAEWLEMQSRADDLFDRSDELMELAIDNVLHAADVICTTNSTAGSDLMTDRSFDLLVLDEATQATEPSCLIPLTKARRVVLAGDHRQLPPTIKNRKAAQQGLKRTLFEKLVEQYGEKITSMLSIQYRMHEQIMTFSSEHFYNGKLDADESVRAHTLEDLNVNIGEEGSSGYFEILDPAQPLVFVNTRDMGPREHSREGSHSKENELEAKIVRDLVNQYLEAGLTPGQIGIIAPYDDQVKLIESLLDIEELEIKTVDGFQGREKEVILLSLTRSNDEGTVGFLSEKRRFNVALTRARRKCIVIGDEATLNTERLFRNFIKYSDQNGQTIIYSS